MKKSALTTIISILLIVAGVFGLVVAGFGVKDGLAIKQYKEDDAKAADVVGELEKAIGLLKENEADYLEGVGAYSKGLSDYSAGQKAYNSGKAELNQGYMDYEAGKKALAEGKAKLAEGQAKIDANTQAYNEGKALFCRGYADGYFTIELPLFSAFSSSFIPAAASSTAPDISIMP